MKRIKFLLIIIAILNLTIGCSVFKNSSDNNLIIRQAENTPEKFVPANGVSLDSDTCKSPMIDPRDGTQLLMVSASGGMANYKIVTGKYGLKKGELLRIDCSTGVVVGIVKE